ncbi:hypothetical protein KIN20_037535 [Parelaphostrongylus tenuis]|uniref:Uncharacterized protein n=1 Tax=Parelaphostrongylus tenuis TaxID=148309 RepID=A0AAD5REL7_PARTN|nr:hypothetical protein KIN20_037535 [Parelaphostrongylus tenuis]
MTTVHLLKQQSRFRCREQVLPSRPTSVNRAQYPPQIHEDRFKALAPKTSAGANDAERNLLTITLVEDQMHRREVIYQEDSAFPSEYVRSFRMSSMFLSRRPQRLRKRIEFFT